jgi:hypothetical protein
MTHRACKVVCILIIIIASWILFGCATDKHFNYSFNKVYVPLAGESAMDPAPWPH